MDSFCGSLLLQFSFPRRVHLCSGGHLEPSLNLLSNLFQPLAAGSLCFSMWPQWSRSGQSMTADSCMAFSCLCEASCTPCPNKFESAGPSQLSSSLSAPPKQCISLSHPLVPQTGVSPRSTLPPALWVKGSLCSIM